MRSVKALGKYHRKSPEALDADEVRRYLYYLQGKRRLKPSSLRVHLAGIRFLYKVALDRPGVVARLRGPKIPHRLHCVVTGGGLSLVDDEQSAFFGDVDIVPTALEHLEQLSQALISEEVAVEAGSLRGMRWVWKPL